MAAEKVTDQQIALGERFRNALLTAHVPVRFLLWYRSIDEEGYRLLLETPMFNEIGVRRSYEWFDRLFNALTDADLSLEDITLILPGSLLALAVETYIDVSQSPSTTFHGGIARIGGHEVPLDSHIYISRPAFGEDELKQELKQMELEIRRLEAAA